MCIYIQYIYIHTSERFNDNDDDDEWVTIARVRAIGNALLEPMRRRCLISMTMLEKHIARSGLYALPRYMTILGGTYGGACGALCFVEFVKVSDQLHMSGSLKRLFLSCRDRGCTRRAILIALSVLYRALRA